MANPSQSRWSELWQRLGGQGDGSVIYEDLFKRYHEPHRAYHNFAHIEQCLLEFGSLRSLASNPDAIELAIWFHDAVYDTHAKDNEELSAELAVDVMQSAAIPASLIQTVSNLILATKHAAMPADPDAALFVDVDLSILGQSAEKFDEYEFQIRQEYNWVESKAFIEGRSRILEIFVKRPRIYSTECFHQKYENQARENLARSIARLKTGV
ncbi:HD domain-containing protein [Pedosphaera parvula]|uniref:N-methyl-D-aspartate receptor NMDAR2C subunit n=1 Tax=Pedosphaera parvula (strain Ellin514) TaxID=320771 RepID=B9X9R0_PEDPL|nr:hypothetical protein [Pedosphaera parvula]EEF63208.1 conserved hypothetical protein [Pedosphaera parvula Ellin514]